MQPQDMPLTGGHSTDIPSSAMPANPPNQAKKPRKPAMQWLHFFQVDRLELFEYRGKPLMKENFFLGVTPLPKPRYVFVPPWAWVHTFRLVKGSKRTATN